MLHRIYSALLISFLFLLPFPLFAEEAVTPLNKVTIELNAETWVTTKTALVTVGINATLADKAFERIHGDILTKLKQLSSQAEWHLTSFSRNVDKSGLEQLQAQAVARLPETDMGNLRAKVKSISKPGETYTVDDIQYTPSDAEMRDAKAMLRENIYQQINVELTRLNKDFPAQKYYLNEANFVAPVIMPMAANTMSFAKVSSAPMMSVSDKMQLTAMIVLASQAQK